MLGNEAAHGDGEISRQDVKDALEFTEAMLSYIYTYRQSFDFFKRRRDVDKKDIEEARRQEEVAGTRLARRQHEHPRR